MVDEFSIEGDLDDEPVSEVLCGQLGTLVDCVRDRQGLIGSVTLVFTDDEQMRKLNGQYRDKDRTTDVLSFDLGPSVDLPGQVETGYKEIYISVAQARRQATELGVDLTEELGRLFVHGLLHLSGWDHETEEKLNLMEKETDAILAHIGLLSQ
jgi:probable rRNA maturation factor